MKRCSVPSNHTGNKGGSKRPLPRAPGTGCFVGLMADPHVARGARSATRTISPRISGNGRVSGNAKIWRWVFFVYTAPKNAPTHTAAVPGHRTYCPRAKRAQVCPQTPRGWFLARARLPAQKVRVACAELSATKIITLWGGEVIESKENLKIYHYAHARNGATRV